MTNQFKQALALLRDLADMQNGAPLIRYEKEYNELMQQVYDFLNKHEEPIEPMTEEEKKHLLIKSHPEGFTMKEWLDLFGYKDGVTLTEPLDMTTKTPKGMHPKTWQFLTEEYSEENDEWHQKQYDKFMPFGIDENDD